MMLFQSIGPAHKHNRYDDAHALTMGIGLLPCPLTISVLGFALVQGTAAMVGMALLSLALGITLTIGIVALAAILIRNTMGATLAHRLPDLERRTRLLQGFAAVAIIAIGYSLTNFRS